MAVETKDEMGAKEGAENTVGIRNDELRGALMVVQRIKMYEHALSRRGVRQEVANRLGRLGRVLREHVEQLVEDHNELVDRFGERKDPDNPATARVAKDSPHRAAFNEEVGKLNKVEVPIDANLRLKQSELRVRDEEGEMEDIDIGGLADLGPLLIWDGGENKEQAAAVESGRERPRSRKRA